MRLRWFLFAALLLASVTMIGADQSIAVKPGGWSEVAVTDEGVVAAAAFAVQARQKARRENGDKGTLSLEKVAAAEQQVVQGMNYRLTLRVLDQGTARTAEAVVWARVWLDEDDRYQLTSWRFTDATAEAGRSPD
ncbi:MAG: cystatin domain-containing protein [Planctomycetota bacterium]